MEIANPNPLSTFKPNIKKRHLESSENVQEESPSGKTKGGKT